MSRNNSRNISIDDPGPRDSIDELRSNTVSGERQISISSNRPATTILATDHVLNPNHVRAEATTCCGIVVSGNSKTLLISTFLFLAITSGQYFAAIAAASLSLKADCISMLVDALSYIANLFAECTPNPRTKKKMELSMSMISLALLSYFTIDFLLEAIENINHVECICDGPDDEDNCHLKDSDETCEAEDDVNAYIVLGFALGGLLFDVISLWAYKHYASDGSSEDEDNEHPHHHHLDDHPLSHRHHDEEDAAAHKNRPNVNMLSALMHVFSDLLRSTTTFVESIVLFQYPDIDSVVVDGWAALIVCSLIAIGAVWSLGIWVGEVYTYCTGDDDDEEDNDMKKKFIDHV